MRGDGEVEKRRKRECARARWVQVRNGSAREGGKGKKKRKSSTNTYDVRNIMGARIIVR